MAVWIENRACTSAEFSPYQEHKDAGMHTHTQIHTLGVASPARQQTELSVVLQTVPSLAPRNAHSHTHKKHPIHLSSRTHPWTLPHGLAMPQKLTKSTKLGVLFLHLHVFNFKHVENNVISFK